MSSFSRRLLIIVGLLATAACGSIPRQDSSGKTYDRVNKDVTPSIVFIHGMFMTPKCWDGWKARFERAGYTVAAPAWPLHEGSVEDLRKPEKFDALAKLELAMVVDLYRQQIKSMPHPVVAIGHSMGGLAAQILLAEGTVDAAVVIHSAPPHHVFSVSWSALKSNWGIISPFSSEDHPVEKDLDGFSYAFDNGEPAEEQARVYQAYYVPESRRVGRAPLNDAGNVDAEKPRGPLLMIAGDNDHIIPAGLAYKNFEYYEKTPGYTEFALFSGRDHWTIGADSWQSVADLAMGWIGQRFSPPLASHAKAK